MRAWSDGLHQRDWRAPRAGHMPEGAMKRKKEVPGEEEIGFDPTGEAADYEDEGEEEDDELFEDDDLEDDEEDLDEEEFEEDFDEEYEGSEDDIDDFEEEVEAEE
jgi:DNA-directed RNA polymerase subunit delta